MSNVISINNAVKNYKKLEDIKFYETKDDLMIALEILQKDHFLINRNGSVYILEENEITGEYIFSQVEAFKVFYKNHFYVQDNKKIMLTTLFLESHKTQRLKGLVFDPTNPKKIVKNYFNMWRGWNYEPIEGNVDLFLKLVAINCNYEKEVIDYFLNYCAHAIQKPGELPRSAIVIRGEQGSGKGTLINDTILKLNKNSKHVESMKQLLGEFNGHLSDAFFICADEISFGGDIKEANHLKTFITENERFINDKNKTAYRVKVFNRIFILSNNDFIVNIESTDRRYIVTECSDEIKGNFEWFKEYHKWLKNGGLNNIMYYLLNRNIENFNPLEIIKSKFKTELQIKSTDLSVKFFIDYYCNEFEFPSEIIDNNRINRNGLYNFFSDWCKKFHGKQYMPNSREFAKTILKAFDFKTVDPNWRTSWKDKNGYYYKFKREHEMMQLLSKNIFKTEPEEIFFNYLEVKRKNENYHIR